MTDDLYREIILDHFRNPRNRGKIENADVRLQGSNPLCGDELEIFINLDGVLIKEVKAQGIGCSISQASLSMMTEAIKGRSLRDVESIAQSFRDMILTDGGAQGELEEFEELHSLEGVKKYPVRIKCAILSWETLLNGIWKTYTG